MFVELVGGENETEVEGPSLLRPLHIPLDG